MGIGVDPGELGGARALVRKGRGERRKEGGRAGCRGGRGPHWQRERGSRGRLGRPDPKGFGQAKGRLGRQGYIAPKALSK